MLCPSPSTPSRKCHHKGEDWHRQTPSLTVPCLYALLDASWKDGQTWLVVLLLLQALHPSCPCEQQVHHPHSSQAAWTHQGHPVGAEPWLLVGLPCASSLEDDDAR